MIKISAPPTSGFKVMAESGEWKVGMLRYSERFSRLGEMERHMLTDELFVLLSGAATLYTNNEIIEMKVGYAYNVPSEIWHHVVVDKDACVMVVENRNTSAENTQKKIFYDQEGK